MANIKGITIEIGGNTSKLQKALSEVDKTSKSLSKELKEIDRSLKFNPQNVELSAQKFRVLKDAVDNTSERLNLLKKADEGVKAQLASGKISQGEYEAFRRELIETENKLGGLKGKFEEAARAMDDFGKNPQRLSEFFHATGKSAADFSNVLGSDLARSVQSGKASLDECEIAVRKIVSSFNSGTSVEEFKAALDGVGSVSLERLIGESAKADNALQGISERAGKASESIEKMGSSESFGSLLSSLKQLDDAFKQWVIEPLKQVYTVSLEAFQKVDEGLDIVVKKTGASGEALKKLDESFYNVAKRVPSAFKEVGEAVGELNTQFGLTGEALDKASEYMLKFSKINDTSVTGSVVAAKKAIELFGLSVSSLPQVLDSVTKTAQDTGVSVDKLFELVVKGAPQLKALGLSFEESVALLGRLEQAGIDAGKALSFLTKAQAEFAKEPKDIYKASAKYEKAQAGLMKAQEVLDKASESLDKAQEKGGKTAEKAQEAFNKAAAGVDKASEAFKRAGDTFGEAQNKASEHNLSLKEGLELFSDKLKGAKSDTERLNAAVEIFGTKGGAFMLEVLKSGAMAFDDLKASAEDAKGAVESTFENTLDPIDQYSLALQNLSILQSEVSRSTQEVLAPAFLELTKFLGGLVSAWQGLNPVVKTVVVSFGLFAFAVGSLVGLLGKAAFSFVQISTALGLLKGALGVVAGSQGFGLLSGVLSKVVGFGGELLALLSKLPTLLINLINPLTLVAGAAAAAGAAILSMADKACKELEALDKESAQLGDEFYKSMRRIQNDPAKRKRYREIVQGIKWYDKGGIFTSPSIIGVGEKRPEFVGALDDLKGLLRATLREEKASGGVVLNVSNVVIRETADVNRVMDELDKRAKNMSRAFGVV